MKNKTIGLLAIAAIGTPCLLGYVASQWPAQEHESIIPPGRIESANFLGQKVRIIKTTNGLFLLKYPTGIPAN